MLRGIRPGELDRRVVVKYQVTTNETTTNQELVTWTTLKSKWVKRLIQKSNESFEANQQVANQEVKFFGRYDADLDETMAIEDDGVRYYIKGIESVDRKTSMTLTCEKRDNE